MLFQNRRKFLSTASLAMMASLDSFASAHPFRLASTSGYSLKVLATNWGYEGSMDAFAAAIKKEGYDGMEVWWPGSEADHKALFDALKKYQLEVGFLVGGWQSDFKEHYQTFETNLKAALTNKYQRPLYVNCHSARDYFTDEQKQAFIDLTIKESKASGIKVLHETHRSRMLFAAHTTAPLLQRNKDMRITLDISHWCNVHESLLADQPDAVQLALQRTDHIHARIGHPEGPQVSDPRAKEWEGAVNAHVAWWDQVFKSKKEKGEAMTVLTEFGPPDYMWTEPHTRKPVSDQWAINAYMLQFIKNRYR